MAKSNEMGKQRKTDSKDDDKNLDGDVFLFIFYVMISIVTVWYGQLWFVVARCICCGKKAKIVNLYSASSRIHISNALSSLTRPAGRPAIACSLQTQGSAAARPGSPSQLY